MTTLVVCDGEGVPADTVLTTANLGTGDTVPLQIDGTITKKSDDVEFPDSFEPTIVDGNPARIIWDVGTDLKKASFRYYFKKDIHPSGHMGFLTAFDTLGALSNWESAISGSGAPGQVRFYPYSGGNIASAVDVWTTGSWYRMEGQVDMDTGAGDHLRFLIYALHDITPLYDSGWIIGQNLDEGFEQIRWMCPLPAPANGGGLRLAHLEVTDDPATLIGPKQQEPEQEPLGGVPTLRGTIGSGGTLSPVAMRGMWDGAAMIPLTPRRVV